MAQMTEEATTQEALFPDGRKKRRPAPSPGVWEESTLPLGWRTRIDPATIVCNIFVPGDPKSWSRPRFNHKTGNVYTDPRVRDASRALGFILLAANRFTDAVPGPIAMHLWFKMKTARGTDIDNLAKMVMDAANGIIYRDDEQVDELTSRRSYRALRPGTEILIWRR